MEANFFFKILTIFSYLFNSFVKKSEQTFLFGGFQPRFEFSASAPRSNFFRASHICFFGRSTLFQLQPI